MLKQMPTQGTSWDELRAEMLRRGEHDARWREGKTAVYVFNAGEDVSAVQKEAYTLYMSENGLGPLAFPSLKQMEDEVGYEAAMQHFLSREPGVLKKEGPYPTREELHDRAGLR